jgi:regulator of protease activity HflC (stomatin/prohibitin superfamily)
MKLDIRLLIGAVGLGFVVLCVSLWGCPQYNVYRERLDGEAELARAEYTRRTAVLEAQAKLDSASKLAEAEVARAQGVAKANQIIGASLRDNEAYLRYLWIDKLDSTRGQIIYVPTEANLPILEAARKPREP